MANTAPTQEWKAQVRIDLLAGTELNAPYLLMNILAAAIASYGLLANSPAIIIGAMIVAMLLGPIAGIALALVDGNRILLGKGILTLLAGTAVVLATSFVIASTMYEIPLTDEIMARTAPNIIDLMVALAGGAAGAYATVSPRLSVAFVGVAIATALVPPLCSASILFAHGEFHLGMGAVLLTFTNMVAIQFSSSTVFWLCGFHQLTHREGRSIGLFLRQNSVSLLVLVILGLVLSGSLHRAVNKQLFQNLVHQSLAKSIDAIGDNHLVETRFEKTPNNVTLVRAVVRGTQAPTPEQVAAIEAQLPSSPDKSSIELRIRFAHVLVINRSGILFSDSSL